MAGLRSDSPVCRRAVLAFLDFLNSVEPAPGVDLEGLDVVRDCLRTVFNLDESSANHEIRSGLLAELFSSKEMGEHQILEPDLGPGLVENTSHTNAASWQFDNSSTPESSNHDNQHEDQHAAGAVSKDELFANFYAALDKSNFFMSSPSEIEDPAQVDKATRFFEDAYKEMKISPKQIVGLADLAEALKSKGNQSMQLQLCSEAIELYTCAIALCEKNTVYYCNRAAAYTQIHKYVEAIGDCLKSIEIDPSYSKAYSRLGIAYYAQGKYMEALEAFQKAFQLDPNNNLVRENIQAAMQKLREQHRQRQADQNARSNHGQGSTPQVFPIPSDFANIFQDIAAGTASAGMAQGQHAPQSAYVSSPGGHGFVNIFQNMATAAATASAGIGQGHHAPASAYVSSPGGHVFGNIFQNMATHAATVAQRAHENPPASSPGTSDFGNIFHEMAAAAAATLGHQAHESAPTGGPQVPNVSEIRLDANVNLDFDEMPEQLSDVLRSEMGVFRPQQNGRQENEAAGRDR